MREIEKLIAAWRAEVTKALGEREALADELEDHLREDLARYRSKTFHRKNPLPSPPPAWATHARSLFSSTESVRKRGAIK